VKTTTLIMPVVFLYFKPRNWYSSTFIPIQWGSSRCLYGIGPGWNRCLNQYTPGLNTATEWTRLQRWITPWQGLNMPSHPSVCAANNGHLLLVPSFLPYLWPAANFFYQPSGRVCDQHFSSSDNHPRATRNACLLMHRE